MSNLASSLLGADPRVDYIILNGLKSPGRAIIRGAGTPRDWDIRKGFGFSGATVVFVGDNLAKFSVEIFLWDFPKHWLEWQRFSKVLERPPAPGDATTLGDGGFLPSVSPKALSIVHPVLNMGPLHITSVVIEDVTQFEQDETGGFRCEIKMLQFRKPKPMLAKPDAATPAANLAMSALDKAEQRNAQLEAQNTQLAAQLAAPLKVPH